MKLRRDLLAGVAVSLIAALLVWAVPAWAQAADAGTAESPQTASADAARAAASAAAASAASAQAAAAEAKALQDPWRDPRATRRGLGYASPWTLAAVGGALVVLAALIGRFAPKKKRRVRRAAILFVLYATTFAVATLLHWMNNDPW